MFAWDPKGSGNKLEGHLTSGADACRSDVHTQGWEVITLTEYKTLTSISVPVASCTQVALTQQLLFDVEFCLCSVLPSTGFHVQHVNNTQNLSSFAE